MKTQLITGLKVLAMMILLLGIIYPLCITGIAQICFHKKANGSLVEKNGQIIGSSLIGQAFESVIYFSSRPSAINYNTLPSGASNLGMTNKLLYQQMIERKNTFLLRNKLSSNKNIPSEMLFASASGLDPHISPETAMLQVNRIAFVRQFSEKQKKELKQLVEKQTEKSQWNLFGQARVNVLLLNLQLDQIKSVSPE